MPASEKHIVIPYRNAKNGLVPGEARRANNPEGARRLAEAMSGRFVGVAAYSIMVDEDTGDMSSPSLLAQHGHVPELVMEY
jgi:hypothetical protein